MSEGFSDYLVSNIARLRCLGVCVCVCSWVNMCVYMCECKIKLFIVSWHYLHWIWEIYEQNFIWLSKHYISSSIWPPAIYV